MKNVKMKDNLEVGITRDLIKVAGFKSYLQWNSDGYHIIKGSKCVLYFEDAAYFDPAQVKPKRKIVRDMSIHLGDDIYVDSYGTYTRNEDATGPDDAYNYSDYFIPNMG